MANFAMTDNNEPPEQISSAVCCQLTKPQILQEDWQKTWFDGNHQHMLLLKESIFFTLAFVNSSPDLPTNVVGNQWSVSDDSYSSYPQFFYHFEQELQSVIIFARISLDFQIIAIQTSPTTIVTVDIINNKKWLIEIRSANDNYILHEGLVWSDHGGNSQDLIVVTSKGLELYKVSTARAQCKLSRIVSQPVLQFWYEPHHRMIMLASQQSQHSNDNFFFLANIIPAAIGVKQGDTGELRSNVRLGGLNMDGYFFKFERSVVPLLELPPPDKVPRFELSASTSCEDIALVSLYGRVFCLVKQPKEEVDFIFVFLLSKSSVEQVHSLSLGAKVESVYFSVCDNLLLCHSSALRATLIFDVLSLVKKNTLQSVVPHATPAYFVDTITKNSLYLSSSPDNAIKRDLCTDKPIFIRPTAAVTETRASFSDRYSDVAVIVDDRQSVVRAYSFSSAPSESGRSRGDRHTLSASRSSITQHQPFAHSRSNLTPGGNTSRIFSQQLEMALIATELYIPGIFDICGGNLVWDSNRKVMWTLRVNIVALSARMSDQRECAAFLQRRGQAYTYLTAVGSSDGILDYSYITNAGLEAKQLLLDKVKDNLTSARTDSLRKTSDAFHSIVDTYKLQHEIVLKWNLFGKDKDKEKNKGVSNSNGNINQIDVWNGPGMQIIVDHLRMQSSQSYPMKEWLSPYRNAQVKGDNPLALAHGSIADNLFSKSMYMRASFSGPDVNNASIGDSIERTLERFRVDLNTLEASLRDQEMSTALYKDIETVGKIISQRRAPPDPNHQRSDDLTLSPVPMMESLRRDVYGIILLTQVEMITHIWLPHFASAEMKYDSVLSLLAYIGLLKEAASIPIAPPLFVLLITVLVSLEEFSELSILFRGGFFSPLKEEVEGEDAEEQQPPLIDSCPSSTQPISTAALQMSDRILQSIKLSTELERSTLISMPSSVSVSMLAKMEAGRELKEFGLRELIRSGRPAAAVEWLLERGLVIEAIEICRGSAIKRGCIPGEKFFTAGFQAISSLAPINSSAQPGTDSDTDRLADCKLQVELDMVIDGLYESKLRILGAVYYFVKREWDPAAVLTTPTRPRSRLSELVPFPDTIFIRQPGQKVLLDGEIALWKSVLGYS